MSEKKPDESRNDARNNAVRAVVRDLIEHMYDGNLRAAAAAIDVSPSQLSELLSEKRGAGMRFVHKLATATGRSVDDLIGGSPAPLSDDSTPRYANLPGWADAEKRVRAQTRYEPWVYEKARGMRGLVVPVVTEAFVISALNHVLSAPPHEQMEAENAHLDKQITAMRKRGETIARKKHEAAVASDENKPPPLRMPARKGEKK